jgi:hypothetical protein
MSLGMYPDEDEYLKRPVARARSKAVTAILGLMIVYYTFCLVVNLVPLWDVKGKARLDEVCRFPHWVIPAVTLCFALNLAWSFLLLQFKKWAFYALLLTSICLCAIPLVGGGLDQLAAALEAGELLSPEGRGQLVDYPILSLIVMAILFVLLRAGGPRSTWSQLE